jgi:MFS family permease
MQLRATPLDGARPLKTRLNRQQIIGFWAAWTGWALDGMDSVIYALVLAPALTELLPRSGYAATPANIGFAGSMMFALFLVGWGLSYIWGPLADRFGRTRMLAATTLVYAVFTGLAAMSHSVWDLAIFRFIAGIGVGGEWALAGTYVAEAWPEDRRKMGAGYLQTGYYAGFFIAAALNYTVGVHFGWRAMFLCGLFPVVVSLYTLFKVREPQRWVANEEAHAGSPLASRKAETEALVPKPKHRPMRAILSGELRHRTIVNSLLVTVAILGLWASSIYAPSAIVFLSKRSGFDLATGVRLASFGTALYSVGVIIGCLVLPFLAERYGRRWTLGGYFLGNMLCIALGFGWAFYIPGGLIPFLIILFCLGLFGGNAAMYALAFTTSVGRFFAAGVSIVLGIFVREYGSMGVPVACTAVFFALGIFVLPYALETTGQRLPS